jgi:putative FmdB family regulatory protein
MPLYDFRCRTCDTVFEERRPMAQADAPATCPAGHVGALRLLPVFATTGAAGEPFAGCAPPVAGGCGAGCACHG